MREFGSEFCADIERDFYFKNLTELFLDFCYLNSGREALGLIATELNLENKIILMPAFCCESMYLPFSNRQWKVLYYPLNSDLTINKFSLLKLLKETNASTILTMNFFGISSNSEIINEIKNIYSKIIIIEDFTHCLLSFENKIHSNVDYYVASIRKWIGVPDGAICLSRFNKLKNKPQITNEEFVLKRIKAQNLKFEYQSSLDINTKGLYRSLFKECELILNYDNIYRMSDLSLSVINNINAKRIREKRRKNFTHIFSSLEITHSNIILPSKNFDECYFCFPIIVNNRDIIQSNFAKDGLYAAVLWPLHPKAKIICDNSAKISDKILSIPIDQRYSYDDIEDIIEIINKNL